MYSFYSDDRYEQDYHAKFISTIKKVPKPSNKDEAYEFDRIPDPENDYDN